MNQRIEGYDLIRSLAILIVFFGHIIDKRVTNSGVLLVARSLSPGPVMALLGFISAALLSSREDDFGSFLVRRFTRIYIPLVLCLFVVLYTHAMIGKQIISQHMLLNMMGLSAFFDLFSAHDKSTIAGGGLWFITIILIMYLLLPVFQKLFKHLYGFIHLITLILICTGLRFVMYGTLSDWDVIIAFLLGAYLGVNGKIDRFVNFGGYFPIISSVILLIIAGLATAEIIPYEVRGLLYAFYPLAFVPLLFLIAKKLPKPIVVASGFFAGLSYEFYILHFYIINENFHDFFPASITLPTEIASGFIITFGLSYIISRIASKFRETAEKYLLGNLYLK